MLWLFHPVEVREQSASPADWARVQVWMSTIRQPRVFVFAIKESGSAGRGSAEGEALRLGTLGEVGRFGPPRFLPLSMRGHNGCSDLPYGAQPMALRLRLVVCPPILSPLPH
ncbi:hypothetical protein C2855_04425 [Aeromonas bestiarum]|nr:hypothetical protein C2855_04425 [Aeromonas bestiarum]